MPIKIGFSTSVCPEWDIHAIATQANEMGFYGVELGTVRDEPHLPAAEDLQSDKDVDAVRKLFADNSVELVSLASKYSMESPERNIRDRCFSRNVENIELAAKLACPFVRIPVGKRVAREPVDHTLARTLPPMIELARIAARHEIILLICNTADFPDSRHVWFVVDGVSHPSVRAAWNPVLGRTVRDTPTLAVTRLGARMRMIMTADAAYDDHGAFGGFRPIGEGQIDYALAVDLLKGVMFDGYLMLDWPAAVIETFPPADDALPKALAHLLERIKHQEPELTAYKKDSKAPNWSAASASFVERKTPGAAATKDDSSADAGTATAEKQDTDKPRVPKGGDPEIARKVAEAVARVRAARKAKGG